MYEAACRPKISAGVCEWTYQVALSGPNHPGSPVGFSNSMPRKNFARTFSSNFPFGHEPTTSCGSASGTRPGGGSLTDGILTCGRSAVAGAFMGRPLRVRRSPSEHAPEPIGDTLWSRLYPD